MTSARTSRIVSLLLLVAAVLAVSFATASRTAFAAVYMPITGYAWSSNAGWIDFSGPGYGVQEDKATRVLSGYAWSSNIGWISFNVPDGGHPAGTVDVVTGNITGWARACAAFADKNGCSGALDGNSGGWDGWISLSGTAADSSAYGIVQGTSCAWTGYGWGSSALGWISSSGTAGDSSAYGVSGNDPGTCAHSCIATLSAAPSTVNQGENSTLSWSVSGGSSCAASCSGSGFNTGGAISGSVLATVPPTPPSTAYALTCLGGTYGPPPPVNTSVTVIVPTVDSFTVNGQSLTVRVKPNVTNNVTVVWSSSNSTSCTIAKNGSVWQNGLSSAGVSDTVSAETIYKMDCVNAAGTHATATVTVNILDTFQEF